MNESVIVSAARTPVGKFGGGLKSFSAVELGSLAIREAVNRADMPGEDVDLVIMGQVLQGGCGQIPSRQAAVKAGLPTSVPSETLNKVCASSFRAVTLADQIIRCGDAQIVVAGGMESMSNAPYVDFDHRWGKRMFNSTLVDLMVHDGLWCPVYDRHMAVHGGVVATEYGISRQAQDEWAVRSQTRAAESVAKGVFREEIFPVTVKGRKGDVIVADDEGPRPGTTYEALAKLPPLFTKDNTVTAGNAPSTNDAGSALMVMSAEQAAKRQIKPLATIVGHAMSSEDIPYIATAPGNAVVKLLKKANLSVDDIDLFEINEAFAAVVLVSGKIAGWDPEKVNVNGGAIALGHPIGASGGRVIMTLIYEMRRRKAKYGVAAICSGAAQGDAILVRCDY
ncbi:acetyl-CoA C-acetyltransferase [Fundidesulfovibrio butyratiphilus]